MKTLSPLLALLLLFSCVKPMKFNKQAWSTNDDLFPCACRPKMLDDLFKNHRLIGSASTELVNLLGRPDEQTAKTISYEIVVDYGSNIDPVYTKSLVFDLDSKGIVKKHRLVEWKR